MHTGPCLNHWNLSSQEQVTNCKAIIGWNAPNITFVYILLKHNLVLCLDRLQPPLLDSSLLTPQNSANVLTDMSLPCHANRYAFNRNDQQYLRCNSGHKRLTFDADLSISVKLRRRFPKKKELVLIILKKAKSEMRLKYTSCVALYVIQKASLRYLSQCTKSIFVFCILLPKISFYLISLYFVNTCVWVCVCVYRCVYMCVSAYKRGWMSDCACLCVYVFVCVSNGLLNEWDLFFFFFFYRNKLKS